MSARNIIRSEGNIRVEVTRLGQVAEYDVFIGQDYMGGGSKREATRLFDKLVRQQKGA